MWAYLFTVDYEENIDVLFKIISYLTGCQCPLVNLTNTLYPNCNKSEIPTKLFQLQN